MIEEALWPEEIADRQDIPLYAGKTNACSLRGRDMRTVEYIPFRETLRGDTKREVLRRVPTS